MITTDNYEEYFLDYIEGRLDENSRREVMRFVTSHPELRAELEEFLDSPVIEDDGCGVPSGFLDTLRHTSDYDEPDVPYFDRLAVLNLEHLATPGEQLEYSRMKYESTECSRIAAQYSATVLTPDDVEYPDKRRLIVLPLWRRAIPYAAAAAVVGLMVLLTVGRFNNGTVDIMPVAMQDEHSVHSPSVSVAVGGAGEETTVKPADHQQKVNNHRHVIRHVVDDETDEAVAVQDDKADEQTIIQVVADEPSIIQVEMLPFDDIDDDGTDEPQKKHRRKFWFACGKALKFVTRRIVPDVHVDIDHDIDGKVSRVAFCSQNKVYAVERK